ncbi:hypothetical protein [Streptomyces sp. NPDC087270]|uniref:hypothetical protein n=1 Tax=Streptomyces sp. NPDC087270 TaxID=3365774 RepID=UPI0038256C8C
MGHQDPDGDFSGLDPARLWDLINSIDRRTATGGHSSAQPLVDKWMTTARGMSLDTSRLTAINRHLSWARGQLPMLRRRHSLAADAARQAKELGGGKGLAATAAGADLDGFGTQAAAVNAARKDAKAYKDGKISAARYLELVQAHDTDPDYCKAALGVLGTKAAMKLVTEDHLYEEGNPDAGQALMADFLATALRSGASLKNELGAIPSELAPLLRFANFPPAVLVSLGDDALSDNSGQLGRYVWPALAADPVAATAFVHDHAKELPGLIGPSGQGNATINPAESKAFAAVLRAGTLPAPGVDPKTSAANTTAFVTYYARHPDAHPSSEYCAVYADIIEAYWPDLQASLTDPAPVLGPGHVDADGAAWAAFIDQAMQDGTCAGRVLAFGRKRAQEMADNDPDNPIHENGAGTIDGVFDYEARAVSKQLSADETAKKKAWADHLSDAFAFAVHTGVDVALDPGQAAATIGKAALSKGEDEFIKLITTTGKHADIGSPPTSTTWQDDWQDAAHHAYVDNPHVGDPGKYANEYSHGKPFLTGDGHLVANATAGQRRAYNEWLKDPATAKASVENFNTRDRADLRGLTGNG